MMEDHAATGPSWRPGAMGRVRGVGRRIVRVVGGARVEEAAHAAYHAVLRRTGQFRPPEDPATIEVLAAIAHHSRTILDIGANVGRYTWMLGRSASPDALVYGIEPHRMTARLLRRTISGLANGTVIEVGLSDHDGTADLVVPTDRLGSSISGLAWIEGSNRADRGPGVSIEIRRLDGLIHDGAVAIRHPVFLKMDVEGGEGRVLRGSRALLHRQRPVVYFECQRSSLARVGEADHDVFDVLGDAGYTIHVIGPNGLTRTHAVDDAIVNYLALPDVASPRAAIMGLQALDRYLERWVAWEPKA